MQPSESEGPGSIPTLGIIAFTRPQTAGPLRDLSAALRIEDEAHFSPVLFSLFLCVSLEVCLLSLNAGHFSISSRVSRFVIDGLMLIQALTFSINYLSCESGSEASMCDAWQFVIAANHNGFSFHLGQPCIPLRAMTSELPLSPFAKASSQLWVFGGTESENPSFEPLHNAPLLCCLHQVSHFENH
jgi:hypothetical protein